MYDRTEQALSLGWVGLVQAIPMLLFTLPAGYLADVFDRRKVIMWSLLGATISSLALGVASYYGAPGKFVVRVEEVKAEEKDSWNRARD